MRRRFWLSFILITSFLLYYKTYVGSFVSYDLSSVRGAVSSRFEFDPELSKKSLVDVLMSSPKNFREVPVDSVKKFWDSRPCNIKHSSAQLGSRTFFNEVEDKKYKVEPHIIEFANFPAWKGKRVLEVGCGLCTETVNFARNGAKVTAIDLSANSIDLCKQRFKMFGLNATLVQGDAEHLLENLNVPAGTQFDLIWSFGVIHHTPHPEKVIPQLHQLLAPNGELRIMLYSKISYKLFFLMKETGIWDFSLMDSLVARYSEAQIGTPVTYTYTFDEVRQLFQGFEILEIKKDHIFPYNIEEYNKNRLVLDEPWKSVDAQTFRNLERELGWHTLIRARKIRD